MGKVDVLGYHVPLIFSPEISGENFPVELNLFKSLQEKMKDPPYPDAVQLESAKDRQLLVNEYKIMRVIGNLVGCFGGIKNLISELPPESRIRSRAVQEIGLMFESCLNYLTPVEYQRYIREFGALIETNPNAKFLSEAFRKQGALEYKKRRDRKPFNWQRDLQIVYLVEKEGLKPAKVGERLLKLNPKWSGKDGQPLRTDTVKKAYKRTKKRMKEEAIKLTLD